MTCDEEKPGILVPESRHSLFRTDWDHEPQGQMPKRAVVGEDRSTAKPQPDGAKRLECAQLAAALDRRWISSRFSAFDRPATSTAAASCGSSKRFARGS